MGKFINKNMDTKLEHYIAEGLLTREEAQRIEQRSSLVAISEQIMFHSREFCSSCGDGLVGEELDKCVKCID